MTHKNKPGILTILNSPHQTAAARQLDSSTSESSAVAGSRQHVSASCMADFDFAVTGAWYLTCRNPSTPLERFSTSTGFPQRSTALPASSYQQWCLRTVSTVLQTSLLWNFFTRSKPPNSLERFLSGLTANESFVRPPGVSQTVSPVLAALRGLRDPWIRNQFL